MRFHLAEIVADHSTAQPSQVWQESIRLSTEHELATLGYTDLVSVDPSLSAARYADQRQTTKAHLLAVAGADPGGPRGPYGHRGIPSRGEAPITTGSLLGRVQVEVDRGENNHLGQLGMVLVGESHRRQGVGTALLRAAEHLAQGLGATTMLVWGSAARTAPDESTDAVTDPSGQVRLRTDDPGVRFALQHGYRLAQAERHSVQPLPVPPEVLLPALDPSRAQAAGYEVVSYRGATPEPYLDSVARLYEAMSTDPPLGEVDYRPETYDAERVRTEEEQMLRGHDVFTTAARHVESGALVAFTQLLAPYNRHPEAVYQENTVVLKGHRGHGLGMLIKATNCDLVYRERPTSRRVHTWNADENEHMLEINTTLGYRLEEIIATWQKTTQSSKGA